MYFSRKVSCIHFGFWQLTERNMIGSERKVFCFYILIIVSNSVVKFQKINCTLDQFDMSFNYSRICAHLVIITMYHLALSKKRKQNKCTIFQVIYVWTTQQLKLLVIKYINKNLGCQMLCCKHVTCSFIKLLALVPSIMYLASMCLQIILECAFKFQWMKNSNLKIITTSGFKFCIVPHI